MTSRICYGPPSSITLTIYADETSATAPTARNNDVNVLCRVGADLTHIPESEIDRKRGEDGEMYYHLDDCRIEAVCAFLFRVSWCARASRPRSPSPGGECC